jgi:hypothetical protein
VYNFTCIALFCMAEIFWLVTAIYLNINDGLTKYLETIRNSVLWEFTLEKVPQRPHHTGVWLVCYHAFKSLTVWRKQPKFSFISFLFNIDLIKKYKCKVFTPETKSYTTNIVAKTMFYRILFLIPADKLSSNSVIRTLFVWLFHCPLVAPLALALPQWWASATNYLLVPS